MRTWRENPEGDENAKATKQHEREVFALKQMNPSQPMIEPTLTPPDYWDTRSPAQLAWLALNGSYGQQLIATRLLEAIAKDSPNPTDN